MKTAMQELQRWVDETPPQQRFATLHIKIEELSGKEEQQLIDAYNTPLDVIFRDGKAMDGKKHYEAKFKTD